jgi:hypothetical protein
MKRFLIRNMTEKELSYVANSYLSGKDTYEISEDTGYSQGTVVNILKKCNITARKIYDYYKNDKLNYNFFDVIDNETKAYFLGLMFADGWNFYSPKNTCYEIGIKLQENDKDILEQFRNYIAPEYELFYIDRSNEKNTKNQYKLKFCDKTISTQLNNLGCIPNKSLTLQYPINHIPKHLENHFIRGYFDGDGSINYNEINTKTTKYLNFRFKITSTRMFCDEVWKIVEENTKLKLYKNFSSTTLNGKYLKNGNGITTDLALGGNRQVYKLMTWLYTDATIFLQRKYDKYLILKSLIENRS